MSTKGTFDELRALHEEIEGLSGVLTTLTSQTHHAEMHASEAAAQFDALVKLKAFAQQELVRKRKVLQRLEQASGK